MTGRLSLAFRLTSEKPMHAENVMRVLVNKILITQKFAFLSLL